MAAAATSNLSPANVWLVLKRLHWTRGLRAGVAVLGAMLVCHLLGKPMGWAALGGFEAILVDNGGPYRSRLETITTLLIGGSIACVAGALAGGELWIAILVTAFFCFATTFLRVASERIASTSVIILVLYFAGFGEGSRTLTYALAAALQFVLGGFWAALLSVLFWPVDPFRPARAAVAECYRIIAEFTAQMLPADPETPKPPTGDFQREMRIKMELARRALGTTAARVTARTVRARNLTVLLETADMLFAITMRWRELAEIDSDPAARIALREDAQWLSVAEHAIFIGLQHRPGDNAASYLPEGSHSLQHIHPRTQRGHRQAREGTLLAHLLTDERDALENIQIAFEAVRAIWSGIETNAGSSSGAAARWDLLAQTSDAPVPPSTRWYDRWTDALRANWSFASVMMRHALRMGLVGAADVILMRLTHVRHGSWLGMTSIIVLQPYGSGTLRRGVQRVGGTIAGGLLAAVLATLIHSQIGLITVITIVSTLTLATYAVNYAWYCFFLTPTFVLMSMPYFRDWQFAEVRMANTILGALVAVLAMRLLWPEREHIALGRLLGRGAAAGANYLRAMLRFWQSEPSTRAAAERQSLAPARRLSGLAINDAEESLDRMMLEPSIKMGRHTTAGDGGIHAESLAFVTYLRRLMRVATTLTAVGSGRPATVGRVTSLIDRLEAVSAAMLAGSPAAAPALLPIAEPTESIDSASVESSVEEQQMRRMERQVGVLERTAFTLLSKTSA